LSRSESLDGYLIVKKGNLVSNIMLMWKRGLGVSEYDGIVSPSYSVFSFNKSFPKYYHYLFRTDQYVSEFRRNSRGVIESRLRLYDDMFGSIYSHYPPLQEQEQIVNFLDEKTTIIDKLISTKERKIELLKEQRTTLINEVITKGLNPNVKMKDSGVEWIGEIPESWSFVRLGVLGKFSKGKGITKDKIKEKGFPCIRNGEIYTTYHLRFSKPNSFIDEQTINESIKVKKGTLFFTGDGETLEEIGKCVVYLGEEEIYVGGGINVFTPNNEKVSPIYLSYVMSSTSSVYQKSKGGKGEIVVHIYSKQLRDIQFGLPKLDEQQKIVDYLDKHTKEIDDLVQLEQNKIELLKEYRQSLISEVITGKIKVI
jgi:type I restriction enzyme S subunit